MVNGLTREMRAMKLGPANQGAAREWRSARTAQQCASVCVRGRGTGSGRPHLRRRLYRPREWRRARRGGNVFLKANTPFARTGRKNEKKRIYWKEASVLFPSMSFHLEKQALLRFVGARVCFSLPVGRPVLIETKGLATHPPFSFFGTTRFFSSIGSHEERRTHGSRARQGRITLCRRWRAARAA